MGIVITLVVTFLVIGLITAVVSFNAKNKAAGMNSHHSEINPSRIKDEKVKFPGVLWLLPIFFGPLGGIIAAVIASTVYHASWWELLLAGFFMIIVYLAIGYFLGWSMISCAGY